MLYVFFYFPMRDKTSSKILWNILAALFACWHSDRCMLRHSMRFMSSSSLPSRKKTQTNKQTNKHRLPQYSPGVFPLF